MSRYLKRDEIIQHMKDGWELGWATGTRSDGRFWLQKPALCRGGESIYLHSNTVWAMIKKKTVEPREKGKTDPFWLTRYRLVGT
jgi:hypothetical protein